MKYIESTNTSEIKIISRDADMLPQRHQILNIYGPSTIYEGALGVAKRSI